MVPERPQQADIDCQISDQVPSRRHFELALLPPARRTGYLAGLDR
jgi:hypothetical protein